MLAKTAIALAAAAMFVAPAAQASTKDKGDKGGFGKTQLVHHLPAKSQTSTSPLNPDVWDDFEGYPHPK